MSGTRRTFRTRLKEYLAMEPQDLIWLMRDGKSRFSAKMARRIYEGSTDFHVRTEILHKLAWDLNAPWRFAYLWRELEKHKSTEFGDWVLTRMAGLLESLEDARKMVALYHDIEAHPMVRGCAVFGMHYVLEGLEWPDTPGYREREKIRELARALCEEAVADPLPYARAGAGWLIEKLGGFESDVERLSKDETPIYAPGSPKVCDHFLGCVEDPFSIPTFHPDGSPAKRNVGSVET
ncbi:MAG: hypothetical protein K8R88_05855 [Armatimonadetes bacterium]|nr:hypothetical protein [Armatimonadota bacterium]